jgi:hypothetical protein
VVDGHGERAIVLALNETIVLFRPARTPPPRAPTWQDGLSAFDDVMPGMRLRVEGWRTADCVIEAWRVALDASK